MNGDDSLFLVVFSRWKKMCFGLQSKFVNFKGDFSHYKRISPPNPVLLCDFGFCVCFHQRCPSCGQPTRSTTAQSSTTWPPPSDSHPLSLSLHGCVFHFKALHGRFGVFKVHRKSDLLRVISLSIRKNYDLAHPVFKVSQWLCCSDTVFTASVTCRDLLWPPFSLSLRLRSSTFL